MKSPDRCGNFPDEDRPECLVASRRPLHARSRSQRTLYAPSTRRAVTRKARSPILHGQREQCGRGIRGNQVRHEQQRARRASETKHQVEVRIAHGDDELGDPLPRPAQDSDQRLHELAGHASRHDDIARRNAALPKEPLAVRTEKRR